MLQRTFERVRRLELHNGIPPSHYEPGASPNGAPADDRRQRSGRQGQTEEREAVKL